MAALVHTFLVLLVFTNHVLGRDDTLYNRYFSLITAVHKYYGTSSVFLIFSSNNRGESVLLVAIRVYILFLSQINLIKIMLFSVSLLFSADSRQYGN